MKDIFTYVGILALSLFSFYYTDKVIDMVRENDPIMIEIMKEENKYNKPCSEGYITNEGVVIGSNGKVINKIESYNNMKGIGYDESLLVFEESTCNITKESYIDKYIIKGNKSKNGITLLIDLVNKNDNLIENIASDKNIDITYIVDDNFINENEEFLLNTKYDFIYKSNNKDGLEKYIKLIKKKKLTPYCITIDKDNLDLCGKEGINTIKTNNYIDSYLFINAKKYIDKGSLIVIKNNESNLKEISVLINYINNKGFNIMSINKHLES